MTIEYRPPIERRLWSAGRLELRALDTSAGALQLSGLALPYGVASQPIADSFVEQIDRGAFGNLRSARDVKATVSHDSGKLLGRTKNHSLTLDDREDGLYFRLQLVDTQLAKDVAAEVRSGLLDGVSVGFVANQEDWPRGRRQKGKPLRVIRDADLFEVSIVSAPAYATTVRVDQRSIDRAALRVALDDVRRQRHRRLRDAGRRHIAALTVWLAP